MKLEYRIEDPDTGESSEHRVGMGTLRAYEREKGESVGQLIQGAELGVIGDIIFQQWRRRNPDRFAAWEAGLNGSADVDGFELCDIWLDDFGLELLNEKDEADDDVPTGPPE